MATFNKGAPSKSRTASRPISALLWAYIAAVFRILAQLAITVFFVRTVGAESYGVYAAALVVSSLVHVIGDAGIGSTLVRRQELLKQDISTALSALLLISVALAIFIWTLSESISAFFRIELLETALIGVSICIVLSGLATIPLSLLKRELRFKEIGSITMAGYVFGYGVIGVPLAIYGFGFLSLMSALVAQSFFVLVLAFARARFPLALTVKLGSLGQWGFAGKVLGVNVVNWAIESIDNIFVSRGLGASELGRYAACYATCRSPANHLVASLQAVLFPTASRVEEPNQIRTMFLAATSAVATVSLPFFCVGAMISETVVTGLYGITLAGAGTVFALLCIAMAIHTLLAVSGPILWARGLVGIELAIEILVLIILLVLLFIFSSNGAAWVAASVAVSYFLRWLLLVHSLGSDLGMPVSQYVQALRPGALITICCAGGCAAAIHFSPELPPSGKLVFHAAVFVLVYVASIRFLLVRHSPEDLRVALMAFSRQYPRLGRLTLGKWPK